MTDKKEKILNAALELFAKEGYKPTSTSKVAKLAGVSEGLIFRHFKNKEGLLNAILQEGEEQAKVLFADIIFEEDPEKLIEKAFNIFKSLYSDEQAANFWKLQYKIKWEIEQYGEHKMEPLELALANAFGKLGYKKPELEARLFLITGDGLATRFFLQKNFNFEEITRFFESKYKK